LGKQFNGAWGIVGKAGEKLLLPSKKINPKESPSGLLD